MNSINVNNLINGHGVNNIIMIVRLVKYYSYAIGSSNFYGTWKGVIMQRKHCYLTWANHRWSLRGRIIVHIFIFFGVS